MAWKESSKHARGEEVGRDQAVKPSLVWPAKVCALSLRAGAGVHLPLAASRLFENRGAGALRLRV
jgi:hypothetical protein